ncbi:hypothetical protein THII_3638 [Thioploca ingrica]|uniref:T6SS Phospholipase effector Tle1-like catalytic domain-containing protein n=1 Tax=Thioploca ingrica TaxID=40754 RepID=A0A090AQL2_9GAMM|nr:hypothetical protein THII_3638 [Thioploca ingrica]
MNTLSSAGEVLQLAGNPNQHKSLFVFLDGTTNNPKSGTNVWRLFKLLENNDPQTTALYIEGVGSIDNSPWRELTEKALGLGMQDRILKGYDFIASHYNPGDDIYLFGFSRGAHEARSLAGFLAYVGVPVTSIEETDEKKRVGIWNKILDWTKDKSDEDYLNQWTSWKPGQPPVLANEIKNKFKLEMQSAEITFLGVWDTVPGSSFKNFDVCKEKRGFVKKWLSFLPLVSKGERYKSDSYPVIRQIAHAVSLDEKRSKFKPLLVCPAINPAYTKIDEMWFPGAHADVGSGYEDSNELPGISLNWMLGLLAKSYPFNTLPQVKENAKGLAHCSICDSPANTGSECEDRLLPEGAQLHQSVQDRKKAGSVPILVKGEIRFLPYPVNSFKCPTQMRVERVCEAEMGGEK